MRIAMYGGALRHWGLLYPQALDEHYPSPGGTETAMMNVARALARRGHQVSVFAECEPGTYEGVDYLKADTALWLLSMVQWDVLVSWQDTAIFLNPVKAKLKVLMSESTLLGVAQTDYAIDRYFGISRFSAKVLLDGDPYARPEKMWITRNGVDVKRFEDAEKRRDEAGVTRNPHRMVWASSPDRGLHHLLDIFPLVKKEVPDAELAICYTFDKTLADYTKGQPGSIFHQQLAQAAKLKELEGVTFYEHLTQPALADLMVQSGVLVYPCDPVRDTETYCNVVNEALAAGMQVVMSNADCLPENFADWATQLYLPVDAELWAETLVSMLSGGEPPVRKEEVRRITSYDSVAEDWERFFNAYFSGKELVTDRSLAATRERLTAK